MSAPLRRGTAALSTDEPLFVFGYGSLIFRPSIPHSETHTVCLRGWRRVFYQGSTDHRGTPAYPGRVVTLLPSPQSTTWGVALRLPPPGPQREVVLADLELREIQYDIRLRADLFSDEAASEPFLSQALVYVGSEDVTSNVNYLGPAPLEEMAERVVRAEGPSGRNCTYLFSLADALRGLGKPDEHVFALEARVRRLLEKTERAPAE